jgi:hypothetical protein
MEKKSKSTVVPRGKGGVGAHIVRMILCTLTGGMAYPNTFVEGMDLTAIQDKYVEAAIKKAPTGGADR